MSLQAVQVEFTRIRIDLGTTVYACQICGAAVIERLDDWDNRKLHAVWHVRSEKSAVK